MFVTASPASAVVLVAVFLVPHQMYVAVVRLKRQLKTHSRTATARLNIQMCIADTGSAACLLFHL
jgi:hypothetical protein